jgi:hypothetical protein
METYVVTKSFMDRYTRKYYGVGSIYETTDPERAAELERGGYIAPATTEAAVAAKAQAQQNQQTNQAANQNSEAVAKAHSEIQNNAEAKTVVGGKVVSLSAAQNAEAHAEANMKQTGIQAHHDNSSEPVQAGQVASQQGRTTASSNQENMNKTVNPVNVQSGQEHLNQAMNASGGSTPNPYVGDGMQQGYEHAANQNQQQQNQAGTTAAQMQAEEAAKTAQAAAETNARKAAARTKKDQ